MEDNKDKNKGLDSLDRQMLQIRKELVELINHPKASDKTKELLSEALERYFLK